MSLSKVYKLQFIWDPMSFWARPSHNVLLFYCFWKSNRKVYTASIHAASSTLFGKFVGFQKCEKKK